MASRARAPLTPPAPLTADHSVHQFSSGKDALDDWLRVRALRAEARSARTYVVCLGPTVVGYYCLAAGAVRIDDLPKKLRRNMPHLSPVFLIGRLAVDRRYQGLNIGKGMLKDALSRALQASETIGARAVMVQAIDAEAAAFYASFGFQVFPEGSQTLFMAMETIERALAG